MEKAKPMRHAMPTVTAWIDDLRAAYGNDAVDPAIRAGIDGQPTFHAREGGHEVGTPIPYDPERTIVVSDLVRAGLLATGNSAPPTKGRRHG